MKQAFHKAHGIVYDNYMNSVNEKVKVEQSRESEYHKSIHIYSQHENQIRK